jgi:hypothetical protein
MAFNSGLSADQTAFFANLILNDPKLREQLLEKVYGLLKERLTHNAERIGYEKRN